MEALLTIALEGNFYIKHDSLWVRAEPRDLEVEPALRRLEGRQVRLTVAHVPPNGIEPGRWGGGSCRLEVAGVPCPAGHHKNPDRMLVFTGEGLLQKEGEGWVLHQFDGSKLEVPLNMMWCHHGRIVGATTDAIEQMKDKLATMGAAEQVEALTGQAQSLREMLDQVKKAAGN